MKDRILEILTKEKRAYSVENLSNLLNIKTVNEQKELEDTLRSMQKEYSVHVTEKAKYMLPKYAGIFLGMVKGNTKGGFAHIDIEGDIDVYVRGADLHGALHGDEVIVKVFEGSGPKMAGEILDIVSKSTQPQVGEVVLQGEDLYVKLDEEKMGIRVKIDPKKTLNAMTGHKVVVNLRKQLQGNLYLGEITSILGHKNDPGIDIKSIQIQYDIHTEFPEEVLKELDLIPNEIDQNDIPNRRDLRDRLIYTIDGEDAKDIDDAIEVTKLPDGTYRLGIHIADVAHYVKYDSAIFKEAVKRATSVYNVDSVVPMLPHKLSNGICSLNGNVDRFAVSSEIIMDARGNIKSVDIFKSIIHSKKRMTYTAVNEIIENDNIPEGYEPFAENLLLAKEAADLLRKNKQSRGMLDFDLDEAKILVDEKGFPIDVVKRDRGAGERLIEDFMIADNEGVASRFHHAELPCIYRVHGIPNEEKIESFLKFLSLLGHVTTGKINVEHSKSIQALLNQFKEEKDFTIISSHLLRSMKKAIYDVINSGHFALGLKDYLHFTSPIRRLPDLIVHMLVKDFLIDNKYDMETINKWIARLKPLAEQSSIKERNAVECEREVDSMKKAEYMTTQIGKEFEGMVTSVVNFGFFVQLPNLIEGLVSVESLVETTGANWFYDEMTYSIKGEHNARGYRPGDTVKVLVKGASKEKRQVDFTIVKK